LQRLSHKVAVNSCLPFDPDSYFSFDDFNSLATCKARCRLFGKTAGNGDWYYSMKKKLVFWAEYLNDFYEVNEAFDCSRLLDGTDLYREGEKEIMRALYVCKRVFTRIIYPLCDEQAPTGFLAGCSIDISAVEMANSLNIKLQRTIESAMEGIALLAEEGHYDLVNNVHAVMYRPRDGEQPQHKVATHDRERDGRLCATGRGRPL
jgi:hypothetical protein